VRRLSTQPPTPLPDCGKRYPIEARAPPATSTIRAAITRIVLNFLGEQPRYADFNNAVGALECAKFELYRRLVAPYEDFKMAENGDVYPAR
jgi:hypothetical protein